MAEYHEEFEYKMRDEFTEKDEEIDLLRQQYDELETRFNQQTTQAQHELHLKQQINESLEKQISEARQRIEMMETTRN